METAALDGRNMVVDFRDIKRIVKAWIDDNLDHRMILRHDDPMVGPLKASGEPLFLLDSNPTAERLAQLLFETCRELQLPVVRVTLWETPSSWASYSA